jgi:hypothetical protein
MTGAAAGRWDGTWEMILDRLRADTSKPRL